MYNIISVMLYSASINLFYPISASHSFPLKDQHFLCVLLEHQKPKTTHKPQTPFVNQQTGRFDASSLQKFLADYKAQKANPSANAQMMSQRIAAHHRLCLFVQLAIDKDQRLIKIERK